MSPALSFSCIEKLPKLLSKECCQTIRPLFCKGCENAECESHEKCQYNHGHCEIKTPRLKVNDICKIFWKQRSKAKEFVFCQGCNLEYPTNVRHPHQDLHHASRIFPKLLGTVRITDVFAIKMENLTNGNIEISSVIPFDVRALSLTSTMNILPNKEHNNKEYVKAYAEANMAKVMQEKIRPLELWKLDGFKSSKDFFTYFEKHYDLSQPKRFAVYRWEWL